MLSEKGASGLMVSATDFGFRVPGFESRSRRNIANDSSTLHYRDAEPFLATILSSSRYNLNKC